MEFFFFIYFLIFFLVTIQTIAGVGVLVVGTPSFLIMGFTFVETLSILLPISIVTSLINLIYFKHKQKKMQVSIHQETKNLFFLICLPSIFVGLLILKFFNEFIEIKYLVAFVIFLSLFAINQKRYFLNLNKKTRSIFLCLTGIIHGLSNSGGSLLSLLISNYLNKKQSRYNITFFYFFLALFQFLIFNFLFGVSKYQLNIYNLALIISLGVTFGIVINDYINVKNFKKIINFLTMIVCVFLIIN